MGGMCLELVNISLMIFRLERINAGTFAQTRYGSSGFSLSKFSHPLATRFVTESKTLFISMLLWLRVTISRRFIVQLTLYLVSVRIH